MIEKTFLDICVYVRNMKTIICRWELYYAMYVNCCSIQSFMFFHHLTSSFKLFKTDRKCQIVFKKQWTLNVFIYLFHCDMRWISWNKMLIYIYIAANIYLFETTLLPLLITWLCEINLTSLYKHRVCLVKSTGSLK